MAGFTDAYENRLLDLVLTGSYWALYTVAPTDSSTGTEVSGNGYARFATSWAAASAGAKITSGTVTSPTATGSWGTIVAMAPCDASTGGTIIAPFTFGTADYKVIGQGDVFEVLAGAGTVTLD